VTVLDRLAPGQYIVIANHNTHIDIMILFSLFPLSMVSKVRTLAAKDYFSSGAKGWLARQLFNVILIERHPGFHRENPIEPIRQAIRNGYSIILFPEGSRGRPGVLAHFKTGVGELAAEFPDIPIIPVALMGIEKTLPRNEVLIVPFSIEIKRMPAVTGRELMEQLGTKSRKDITAELEMRLRTAIGDASGPLEK